MKKVAIIVFALLSTVLGFSQPGFEAIDILDYSTPQEYEIGGIEITGSENTDANAIKAISGLSVGEKVLIPGRGVGKIPRALKKLLSLRLFTDVEITVNKKIGDVIFLLIRVEERPRLSRHSFEGVKKSSHDDLNDEVNKFLVKGGIVTENIKTNAKNGIESYFIEKGFLDVKTSVREVADTLFTNSVRLVFDITKGSRIKIGDIVFEGNENVKTQKLINMMKNTRRKKRWFATSKFLSEEYETDKQALITHYNTVGYRDAIIVKDSSYREITEDGELGNLILNIEISEGQRYHFGNITFKGNSIYSNDQLQEVLGIVPGDVYNQELLDTRISFSQEGRDVSSLYMDNGYLFFQANPTEVSIRQDTIDLEIRLSEGPQATIDRVIIRGNDRTHEHVVRRELRTKPGQKFSRSDIIRSQREIVNLGYFNPESLGINTPVNPQQGTVDIEYVVEEKPSDQLELSAGWGGLGRGVIGTLGVTFNNFSMRNIFNKEAWHPLPQGDGQRLSLRAQTNGTFFQSYNLSLTEPWLGGKKPNAFTVAGYYTRFTNGFDPSSAAFYSLGIGGVSVGLATRLKFPDDFFVSNTTLSFQNISVNNYTGFSLDNGTPVRDGSYNNISLNQTISRNSIDAPIFPTSGSRISLAMQFTPPYSLFNNKDYSELSIQDRFKWLEYHKWRLNAEWYTTLVGKFVLRASAKIGLLGYYNSEVGLSPFERFELGGDGISNNNGIQGKDIISLRGYEVSDLAVNNQYDGAAVFDKFTLEIRYPFSLNPMSTIYALAFVEGGNSWISTKDFNPFDLNRSAGMGLRVFLPMFGTLGFDYGFGFDKDLSPTAKLTDYGRFSIILGFEPE